MMLTIHGLPAVAKYQDVKTLLQRECNLNDFILDNLVTDKDGSKKVRIGVADEMEGAHVMKCLDGFRCGGKMLYVVPIAKSGQGQPNAPQPFEPHGNFQRNDYPMQGNQYGPGPGPRPSGPGPWSMGVGPGPNQWAPNQPQMGDFNYQQQNVPFQQQQHMQRPLNQRELMLQNARGPMSEPFQGPPGGGPQNIIPQQQSRGALRNIETVDLPKSGPGRYQDYPQPKPVIIKKDNFLGPNQFAGNPNAPGPNYQGSSTAWQVVNPINKPGFGKPNPPYQGDKKFNEPKPGILKNPMQDRGRDYKEPRFSPPRRGSPGRRSPGRNISPGRRMPPSDHKMPHPDHKMPPNDQRMARDGRLPDHRMGPDHRAPNDRMPIDHRGGDRMGPNDRRMPDDRMGPIDRRIHDERMGPGDRRIPEDRMGPNDRRMPDDRMGPSGKMPPNDRRIIDDRMGPMDRRMPPDDRMGPNDHRMHDRRMSPGRRISPRRLSPGRRVSPSGRHISPSGRRDAPMGRHISPPGRRMSPSGRRVSPPGRRISPSGRRMSPPPGRRVSPPGRRVSSPGRRVSPSGRRMSHERRMSPSDKRRSPDRPMHPLGRRSPDRRMSPDRQMRYSPVRHPDKADRLKQVRPAYEPDAKAANQAMYSGGYRPNTHEPEPFTVVQGAERISPWQDRNLPGDKYGPKKEEERNRMVSRLSDHGEKRISPRASRSPGRRDRSPIRDRYRRHSPSPRSPRRSWALEKRRSPGHDAPPPPAWPGQSQEEYPKTGRTMPERPERVKVKQPVWENSFVKVEERIARDLPPRREPSPHRFKQDDRFPREHKFERDFPDRRFPEPDRMTYPNREEFIARSERAHEEYKKNEEMMPKNQPPRTEVYRKKHEQFNDEFQDVYQRAVDFAKKTQEMRKRDEHRREPEDHRRGHDGREFFDRHDYRHEERPRSRHSDENRNRQPDWEIDPRKKMEPNNLAKREKAVEEISRRIIQKYINQVEPEIKNRVIDDIKDRLFNLLYDIYGDQDISYIELIIKFNSRFDTRIEGKIFHEAALKFSDQYRGMKRPATGPSEIPAKTARREPQPEVTAVTKPPGKIRHHHRGMRTRKVIVREVEIKKPEPKPQRPKTPPKPAPEPPKPVELEAPPPPQITETRVAEGHYELNPLMARMLDSELQDIMIKVWQALPDEPKSEAEKFVADKFRNETGDTLRNVLGLNVAKRLLNIFNRLMLKIQFTSVPGRTNLRGFLKKYSFVSFKRIEDTQRSFSAQVKTIQDFDRLCSARDLWCGPSKVLVTPNYKFTHRPDKLISTSFEKFQGDQVKTELKDNKEPPKLEKDEEKQPVKTEVAEAKQTQAKTDTQVKPPESNTPAKPTQAKPPQTTPKAQTATQAKPNTQVTPTQTNSNTSTTQVKSNTSTIEAKSNTPTSQTKSNTLKTPGNTLVKPNSAASTQAKTNTTSNSTQAKPNSAASTPAKTNTTANSTQAKANSAVSAQAKANTTANSTQAKPNSAASTPAKTVTTANSTQVKTNSAVSALAKANTTANSTQAKPNSAALSPAKTVTTANSTQAKPNFAASAQAKANTNANLTQAKPNSAATTPAKTNTTANSTQAKPNTTQTSQAKPNTTPTQAKAAQAKPSTQGTPAKPTQSKPDQTKPATAAQPKNTPAKSPQTTQAKPPATKTQNKPAQAKPQPKAMPAKTQVAKKKTQSKARKSFEEKGDFEELDDHDILALMSGGIVLDECIGSDDD